MGTVNNLGREFLGEVQGRAQGRLQEEFSKGYDKAATLCLGILSRRMDDLSRRVSAGTFLTEPEQFLWASLNELKSETERALYVDLGESTSDL